MLLHSAVISRVLERRSCLFVDGVHPCVPLGLPPLFFELCELSPVMDLNEYLPHDDERDAGRHDGPDHSEDDAEDVYHLRTLLGLLDPHLELARLVVVAIHVGEPTLVIVQVCAQPLVLVDELLRLLHDLEAVVSVEGALSALLHAPLISHPVQGPGPEHLALDAGGELVALAWAGGAVLAEPPRVLTLLRLLALALPSLARPVAGAQLVDELAVRGDTGLVTGATLT